METVNLTPEHYQIANPNGITNKALYSRVKVYGIPLDVALTKPMRSGGLKNDDLTDPTIQYDSQGRIKYHPDYHHNHGKDYTTCELSYICKNYYKGNLRRLSLAVGRTERTLISITTKLRKAGIFEFYKNLED
ncbi:hypothetical protein [Sporosarcina cyprini]|uniref:hypothetical protein n=1 Tax=Sporosarcina cyprini TaxID=2910523 RepID=UPI001EDFE921|nr:hypothetical protein [Sporosarcina cyprini]MCG3089157.1 hypothetical protein [Sporosarcina cyprini]